MQNKYDIYTLDWLPQKRKDDNQEAADCDKKNENEPLSVLILFALIGSMVLFGIAAVLVITFQNSRKAAIRILDPYREVSDLHLAGKRFALQGEYDKAIDCYTKGLALDSSYITFYLERGECYEAKGDLSAALADYDHVCLRSPGGNVDQRTSLYLRLAEKEIQAGDIPQALDYYTRLLATDDYSVLQWRKKFNCPYRLRTYVARKQCLENSEELIHRLLAKADSYWIEINHAVLTAPNLNHRNVSELEILLHSLDQDRAYLLSFAEWHYGQKNYALAIECLRRSFAKSEFSLLPLHIQEAFQYLKETLEEMLKEGVPPGILSHTSSSLRITISTLPLPVVVPVPVNESTELYLPHE